MSETEFTMHLIAWWLAKSNRVDAAADANLAAARLLPWPVARIEPKEKQTTASSLGAENNSRIKSERFPQPAFAAEQKYN